MQLSPFSLLSGEQTTEITATNKCDVMYLLYCVMEVVQNHEVSPKVVCNCLLLLYYLKLCYISVCPCTCGGVEVLIGSIRIRHIRFLFFTVCTQPFIIISSIIHDLFVPQTNGVTQVTTIHVLSVINITFMSCVILVICHDPK